MDFETLAVREPADPRDTKPHVLPLYLTSSFDFESIDHEIDVFAGKKSGHTYARYGNPTVEAVAQKIADMESFGLPERAAGIMASSGMAAISTLAMGLLQAGDKILTQGNLYGGTTELFSTILRPLGVEPIFMDFRDLEAVERVLKTDPTVRLLYCESPTNPTLSLVDIEKIAALGKASGVLTAVDNTFSTPFLQRPLAFGIDFVVHSTTKFLNGHGNSIAGCIVSQRTELLKEKIWRAMKLAGTNASPFEAWLVHNGLKTLAVRMEKHCSNALLVARHLEASQAVERVNYPGLESHIDHDLAKKQFKNGFGAMLSFELKGGFESARRFMDALKMCSLAPTLGDTDTLALHPASSSHLRVEPSFRERFGITDGLVRLSVGIESPTDIIADLEQAIRAARS